MKILHIIPFGACLCYIGKAFPSLDIALLGLEIDPSAIIIYFLFSTYVIERK